MQTALQNWWDIVEREKKSFSTRIFSLVENGEMEKLEAIVLLTKYELLPIAAWIDIPEFAEGDDYFNRYSIVCYADLLGCTFAGDNYARFPDTTLEEAIDQVWEIVKDKRIVGCYYDW